jgi:4-hydroxybenzoate polyprenyltransferase
MGADHARSVTARRPKWRAYLLLSRISNLPTVWSNVLAGTVAAHGAFMWSRVAVLAAAVSVLYTAGMFLNDGFDHAFDTARRPDRPLPAGDVSRAEVFGIGFVLIALGDLWVVLAESAAAGFWALALTAAILYYNWRHKRDPFGPLVMGACRGLVYFVAGAAATVSLPWSLAAAALLVTVYVGGLTLVAKMAGPSAAWLIPLLIAGISLLDAGVMLANGGGAMSLVAAAGFVLTLLFQRVVPGT